MQTIATIAVTLAASPEERKLTPMVTSPTAMIVMIGVRVTGWTLLQMAEPGSMLSRPSAKPVLVATVMLASRQEKIEMNATTWMASEPPPPKCTWKRWTTGLKVVELTVVLMLPGIAMARMANTTKPAMPEIRQERIIALGAMPRGSVVSSARSAEPSQPSRV